MWPREHESGNDSATSVTHRRGGRTGLQGTLHLRDLDVCRAEALYHAAQLVRALPLIDLQPACDLHSCAMGYGGRHPRPLTGSLHNSGFRSCRLSFDQV